MYFYSHLSFELVFFLYDCCYFKTNTIIYSPCCLFTVRKLRPVSKLCKLCTRARWLARAPQAPPLWKPAQRVTAGWNPRRAARADVPCQSAGEVHLAVSDGDQTTRWVHVRKTFYLRLRDEVRGGSEALLECVDLIKSWASHVTALMLEEWIVFNLEILLKSQQQWRSKNMEPDSGFNAVCDFKRLC